MSAQEICELFSDLVGRSSPMTSAAALIFFSSVVVSRRLVVVFLRSGPIESNRSIFGGDQSNRAFFFFAHFYRLHNAKISS